MIDAETPNKVVEETEALVDTEAANEAADDIDALLDAEAPNQVVDETEKLVDTETVDEIDDLVDAEATSEVVDDIDDLIDAETPNEAVEETQALVDTEAVNKAVDDIDDIDDLSEFENVDLSTLKSVDQTISELDAESESLTATSSVSNEPLTEPDNIDDIDTSGDSDQNSLAEQLSNGAFNEEVELPSFDKNDDGFIDIDTLLTSNGGEDLNEEDFNLEFGLEDFPDVIESFTGFDNDDDGIAAKLDLARAYLEIDEKEGAKSILTKLLESAQDDKLKEVQKLLDRIR